MNTTATLSHSKAVDADTYWNMLKNLSSEIKLELISKLSASLCCHFAAHYEKKRCVFASLCLEKSYLCSDNKQMEVLWKL